MHHQLHWAGFILMDILFSWYQGFLGYPKESQIYIQYYSLFYLWSSHTDLGVPPCRIHISQHSSIFLYVKIIPIFLWLLYVLPH